MRVHRRARGPKRYCGPTFGKYHQPQRYPEALGGVKGLQPSPGLPWICTLLPDQEFFNCHSRNCCIQFHQLNSSITQSPNHSKNKNQTKNQAKNCLFHVYVSGREKLPWTNIHSPKHKSLNASQIPSLAELGPPSHRAHSVALIIALSK